MLSCEICNYNTERSYDLKRHMRSAGHKRKLNASENNGDHETITLDGNFNIDNALNVFGDNEEEQGRGDEGVEPLNNKQQRSDGYLSSNKHYSRLNENNGRPGKKKKKVRTTGDYDNIKSMLSSAPKKPVSKTKEKDDYAGLYGKSPTKNHGDKRFLLEKVNQYKNLFPDELKSFKIKANATESELEEYIQECDNIVSCKSVHHFLESSILNAIRINEEASYQVSSSKIPFINATLKTNIRGTADLLKQNPEFSKLCKMLFIKYNVFDKVPPEFQMMFLITSTAMYCRNKNANSDDINSRLNAPMI